MTTFKVSTQTVYNCSLERAFKTPMLCDVSKVHTGYGIMPKVTHCTDDEEWGKPGGSKKVWVAKSLSFKGGESSIDKVIERIDNEYWKIEVSEFKTWMLGFSKFEGEWKTIELDENKIQIDYSYTLYADNPLFYPFNWLFARLFWKTYMNRVLENIRVMVLDKEPYQYE